jgi:glutamyl-tRNA synthetase
MHTGFPPKSSGYMHLGHAKAAMIHYNIAHDYKPGAKFIVRFDDTNLSKEKQAFQDAILDDLRTLNIFPDQVTHSSDGFQDMYDYAVILIRAGKAFADDTVLGKGNDQRKSRKPSDRRDMNIDDMLSHFAAMHSGSPGGQKWCLHARNDYASFNGALRDPVIYRCNDAPHHRTGTTWYTYPTYDFCAPILDAIDGVTLAYRTTEYCDRNAKYYWFQDALGLQRVPIYNFCDLTL